MTRSLPSRPSLRFLREQAKDLLKAQHRKDPGACGVLRLLRRFREADDHKILTADVALHEVQFALAMDYGFKSWKDLKEHVAGLEEAAAPKSYGRLDEVFRGHCMKTDTFSLSVQAAAGLLGRPADYETVLVLSTNAFCLVLDEGEDCTAWWHMSGRDVCMDFVGRTLGLEFRRLELPDVGMRPGLTDEQVAEITERTKAQIGPILRQELEDGIVLITAGGWQVTGGRHGFIPWCHWGVITSVGDDDICGATLTGHSLQGHWDTPMEYVSDVYAVRPARGAMDPPAAQAEALRLAAARIRGQDAPFRQVRLHFGLDGMDLWIRHMKQVESFCEPCRESSGSGWRCATSTANALTSGAETAARWLREQAEELQSDAGKLLAGAAEAYQRICKRLQPALSDGEAGYQSLIGDLDRQRAHAETVLLPIRDDLASAAEAIEKAIAST